MTKNTNAVVRTQASRPRFRVHVVITSDAGILKVMTHSLMMHVRLVSHGARVLFCCSLLLATSPVVFGATLQYKHPQVLPTSIFQIIETKNGRRSCRGVVVQLGSSRLRRVINPEQIAISEGKHGHDLRDIMAWRVIKGGRKLIIKFKPGAGDFGGGNVVEVRLARSAFIKPLESANVDFSWVIHTDIM